MTSLLSSMALWLLWQRSADRDAATTMAAMIPIAYWGSFFPATLVPGTALEYPGHRLPRIAGVPAHVLGVGATVVTAGLGWYLLTPV